ncbi:hypothetical protein MPTK1_1g01330 [Marchantia polymorpha subsp. ruderalis]|uniref:Uncharacterized protein n=2 Tax=Marchantia polymorpha TaxID=3197 RepID=A0AAF6AKA3_MARPO|nr:hypothetical protein MARPO_0029s0114 [Marchantia polymorpha]BBM96873.1 hypothetical protein Mp_1g01330 [Marchantia polymorpha subsp. ruderalis]|eukprot:PTQ42611.1 hypothetical protein MARPO_0029s0114 [Marchantia polymorpha]
MSRAWSARSMFSPVLRRKATYATVRNNGEHSFFATADVVEQVQAAIDWSSCLGRPSSSYSHQGVNRARFASTIC